MREYLFAAHDPHPRCSILIHRSPGPDPLVTDSGERSWPPHY